MESFAYVPLSDVIKSYLYAEYSDDDDLQAFIASQNEIAQGYLDWTNQTPLGVYTSSSIGGILLDWIGQGIYDIQRPVLATSSSQVIAGYAENFYANEPYTGMQYSSSGTAINASDDLYKRLLTWKLYRGDGKVFSLGWLKNRITRFIYGVNGVDVDVLDNPPSVIASGGNFHVTAPTSDAFSALHLLYANDALSFPFQYTMTFTAV